MSENILENATNMRMKNTKSYIPKNPPESDPNFTINCLLSALRFNLSLGEKWPLIPMTRTNFLFACTRVADASSNGKPLLSLHKSVASIALESMCQSHSNILGSTCCLEHFFCNDRDVLTIQESAQTFQIGALHNS